MENLAAAKFSIIGICLNLANSSHDLLACHVLRIFDVFDIFPSHNIVYCIIESRISFTNYTSSLRNIYILTYMQFGKEMLHMLQHNLRLYFNTKELKLKFITLKEMQYHKHITE